MKLVFLRKRDVSKEVVFIATSRDVRHAPEYKKSALRKEME